MSNGFRPFFLAFLVFHVGSGQIFCCITDAGTGLIGTASAPVNESEFRAVHEAYRAAVVEAKSLPATARDRSMTQALDDLLNFYTVTLGRLFENLLPRFKGKNLKIFPRSPMHEAPLHAISVAGAPLADHCNVSYAPTIGSFFQARAAASAGSAGLLLVHDTTRTRYYAGTIRKYLETSPSIRVLADATWETFAAALAESPPQDVIFACHGGYNSDDPRTSHLKFTIDNIVPFTRLLEELDLPGCRSVTMGACESGLGRTLLSAEYVGLPLALLAAGARYAVGSLWEVNQISTAILMGEYLTVLHKGERTVPGALADAQRGLMRMSQDDVVAWLRAYMPDRAAVLESLIRKMAPRPYAHPYYWAGMYVVGDV